MYEAFPLLPSEKYYSTQGFCEDGDIQKDIPVFDVVEIVLELFETIGVTVGIVCHHLRPSREAGFDEVAGIVKGD